MSDSPADKDDQPATGTPDLRRTVGEATERIHEINDAAEQVALDIRRDAESEARTYLEERRRDADRAAEERRLEADRAAEERSKELDDMTRSLADTAEEFKHQAERLLADLDRAIVDARASIYRQSAEAAVEGEAAKDESSDEESSDDESSEEESSDDEPAEQESSDDQPLLSLESEPFSVDALSGELPPLDPEPAQPAAVVAYEGRPEGAADDDRTAEALLRATQLAVTGKERDEIADVLRADYPGVDTEPLLDEILG